MTYESAQTGTSNGWFYWTLKTEGGAFSEWNFLLGAKQGWIPNFPPDRKSSESVYGTCEEIASKTRDDDSIVHEFPDPDDLPENAWLGEEIDDDYVLSHAEKVNGEGETVTSTVIMDDDDYAIIDDDETYDDDDDDEYEEEDRDSDTSTKRKSRSWFPMFVIGFFCYGIYRVFFSQQQVRFRSQYTSVDTGFEPATSLRV